MMKYLLLTMLFFSLGLSLSMAQGDLVIYNTNNARESLKRASQLITHKKYNLAIKQLEHTLKIKPDFGVAHLTMARVYVQIEMYPEATTYYESSFELDDRLSRAAYFECGEAYFKINDIKKAMHYYLRYQELKTSRYTNKKQESGLEITYDKMLAERLRNCDYINQIKTEEVEAQPQNMGKAFNTSHDEYLPTTVSNGSRIVFTRNVRNDNEDIMVAEIGESGSWQEARPIGRDINSKHNEGMAKFATHGKTLYYAGCERADSKGGCDIYEAVLVHGEVDKTKVIEGINSPYWDSQPCLSCKGKTIYFSSSRPGGYGGADIWATHLLDNGSWSEPENLGANINTKGDEEAPYIAADGHTLFFSSTGHLGQGDGDIFRSTFNDFTWSKAQNLGYPINSQGKELGFYIEGDGKTAYFASARYGGYGGLDIYKVELPFHLRPKPVVYIEGSVQDATTGLPITAPVKIIRKGEKEMVHSDENGWFFTCVTGGKAYSFQAEVEGYEPFMSAVFLEESLNKTPTRVLIKLIKETPPPPKVVVAEKPKPKPASDPDFVSYSAIEKRDEKTVNFFFEVDSYELTPLAERKLRQLINDIRGTNDWVVKVTGYADSTGNADYNKRLSEKRANAIVSYLHAEKIDVAVSHQEGVGSVSSSTDADKKYNRRVELVMSRK